MIDPTKPSVDFGLAHPLLKVRWPLLARELASGKLATLVVEVFRHDKRQAWLFGQGRTADELAQVGVDPLFARPGARVTNAYSAALSAHGWRDERGRPASCAVDVVPVGADGKPWTVDDPWDEFVERLAGLSWKVGLRHFAKPGKPPWDKPHLQLVEWSDKLHRLVLPV